MRSAIAAAGLIAAPAFAQIQFVDVSTPASITGSGPSFGASWGDLNGDGRPDILVVNHPGPPSLYLNGGDGTFTLNVLPVTVRDAHGAAWGDFDADGDQDLILAVGASAGNQLFVNEGGTLVDRAAEWGEAAGGGARSRTPVWLDWDADGLLDLMLTQAPTAQSFPTILRNTGTGFVDATSITGPVPAGTNRAQLADLTGDGRLDLVLLHGDLSRSVVFDLSTIPFTKVVNSINITPLPPGTSFTQDEVIADLTGDLKNDVFRPSVAGNHELVIQNPTQIDFHIKPVQREEGVTFASTGSIEVKAFIFAYPLDASIIRIGAAGQGTNSFQFTLDPADPTVWGIADHVAGVDNGLFAGYDAASGTWTVLLSTAGNWDANFVITSTSPMSNVQSVGFNPVPLTSFPSFLVSTATGYEARGIESQLRVPQHCYSAVGGDFDNDMDIDLYLACSWPVTNASNILFENLGNGVFAQITDGGGAAGTIEGRSDAVIMADYDEDGFLDLFVTNGEGGPPFNDGPHQLFRNAGNANHWLEIDLVGRFSNPDAIGARIELSAGGTVQLREQGGGMHYRAQNYKRIHFGLGSNTSVDQITIYWPSGIVQTLTNIPVDQILAVSETSLTDCGDGIDNDGDGLTDYPDDPQCIDWSTGSEADQDGDGISDALDNCILVPNLDQLDSDQDGSGDACDADDDNDGLSDIFELSIGTNPLLGDSDGDGLSDYQEVAYDGDPLVYTPGQDLDPNSNDTDADGYLDGVDPIPLLFNFDDGDLVPIGTPNGMIDAGDYLIAMQIVTGQRQVTPNFLAHGDLYPPNAPDGVINMQDALLLLKLVLQ